MTRDELIRMLETNGHPGDIVKIDLGAQLSSGMSPLPEARVVAFSEDMIVIGGQA